MRSYKILVLVVLISFSSCNQNKSEKRKDFDVFWEQSLDVLRKSKIEFEIKKDSIVAEKKWSLYKIKSFNNVSFFAWVSEPLTLGKYPTKIRFSALSSKKTHIDSIPNAWFLKEDNTINMMVDVRGQGLSKDLIEHTDYLTHGLSSKESYVYRGAYMDAVQSVDFIAQNPNSDGNIIVTGGTQGGALSIVAAALNTKVTMCVIGFPFLTDISNYNKKNWPMSVFMVYCQKHELDYFDLIDRLSYFDMLFFAEKIKVPVFIRANKHDNITPLDGIVKFFNKIEGNDKDMYIEPCEGHGCSTNSKKANDLEQLFVEKYIIH